MSVKSFLSGFFKRKEFFTSKEMEEFQEISRMMYESGTQYFQILPDNNCIIPLHISMVEARNGGGRTVVVTRVVYCKACGGKAGNQSCTECGGKGFVQKTENIQLMFAPNTADHQVILIKGYGHCSGPDEKSGDLFIIIEEPSTRASKILNTDSVEDAFSLFMPEVSSMLQEGEQHNWINLTTRTFLGPLHVTREEAKHGCKKRIQIQVFYLCSHCNGTGEEKPGLCSCEQCGGTGTDQRADFKPCYYCKGSKVIKQYPCRKCAGSGYTTKPQEIEINVPADAKDGTVLNYENIGIQFENGLGDAQITVRYVVPYKKDDVGVYRIAN